MKMEDGFVYIMTETDNETIVWAFGTREKLVKFASLQIESTLVAEDEERNLMGTRCEWEEYKHLEKMLAVFAQAIDDHVQVAIDIGGGEIVYTFDKEEVL